MSEPLKGILVGLGGRGIHWLHNGQPTGPQDATTTEDGAYSLTPEALAARKYIYEGAQAMANADLIRARDMYEKGFAQWRLLFDRKDFVNLKIDDSIGQEVVGMIDKYRQVLEKSDKPFPKDFVLNDILQLHEKAWRAREGK